MHQERKQILIKILVCNINTFLSVLLDISDGSAGSEVGGWSTSKWMALCNGDSIWGRDPILCDRINRNRVPPCSLFGFPLASLECGNLYQLNNRRTHTHLPRWAGDVVWKGTSSSSAEPCRHWREIREE